MYDMYNNLWDTWNAYKNVLNKAEEMLQMKQKEFEEIVLRDKDNIEHDFKEFEQTWNKYKKTASSNMELIAAGSYLVISKLFFITHYV